MPFPCHRVLPTIPRWLLAFSTGILISWVTYSLNSRLYLDSHTDRLPVARASPLVFHEPLSIGNLSHLHHRVPHIPPKYQATSTAGTIVDKMAIFRDDSVNMVYWRHADHHIGFVHFHQMMVLHNSKCIS